MFAMRVKVSVLSAAVALAGFAGPGCRSGGGGSTSVLETTPTAAAAKADTAVATTARPARPAGPAVRAGPAAPVAPSLPTIRIDAGAEQPTTDAAGNAWAADTGFTGGDIVDRGDVEIAGTDAPALYRTERYGMEAFAQPLPSGTYTVKLHFAETYDGVAFEGGRVFHYSVEGHEVRNFDVFKEAKRENTALVRSHTVEVTDGSLDVTFAPVENNPVINAIEVLPGNGN